MCDTWTLYGAVLQVCSLIINGMPIFNQQPLRQCGLLIRKGTQSQHLTYFHP